MRLLFSIGLFLISLTGAQATQAELTKFHFSAPHLGTTVHLIFYAEKAEHAKSISKECFQRVEALNQILSDYRDDSELNQLCAKPIGKPQKVSNELFEVLSYAQHVSKQSNGAFDITIGKHSKDWREEKLLTAQTTNYQDIHVHHEDQSITLTKELQIDLGGIGKGYIADQLMQQINQANIQHAAVIIGGETIVSKAPPNKQGWRIGIEDPEHKIIGTLLLENTALSTSGDSYQFFESNGDRYSHLIDPKTQQNKTNRLNVVTLANSSMQADAWATAFRVLPTEIALELADKEPKVEALFLPYQQSPQATENFPTLTKQ